MKMTPLTNSKEIQNAFHTLAGHLKNRDQRFTRTVGWQGDSGRFVITWHEREGMWSLFKPDAGGKSRYWCCFGTADPTKTDYLKIACEINPPHRGINRRCAGAFVVDGEGRILLTHSGKIGGGRSGIGKSAFLAAYRGNENLETVAWPDGVETTAIVIGPVDDDRITSRIAHFVHEVARFKKAKANSNPQWRRRAVKDETLTFRPEFSGARTATRSKDKVEMRWDHGRVVRALAQELEKRGCKIANDRARDLFIVTSNGHVGTLFEGRFQVPNATGR